MFVHNFSEMLASFGVLGILLLILILPFWILCIRTGFSGWFSLVILVPYIGLPFLVYVIAFSNWERLEPQSELTKEQWLVRAKENKKRPNS